MREKSGSTTAWWQWSSWFSGRASLSTTEEEEELEEERAAPWQGCGCPPTLPLFIGARERGVGPLQMDLEDEAAARGNPRWVWAPHP